MTSTNNSVKRNINVDLLGDSQQQWLVTWARRKSQEKMILVLLLEYLTDIYKIISQIF